MESDISFSEKEYIQFDSICPIKLATILSTFSTSTRTHLHIPLKQFALFSSSESFNQELVNFKLAEIFTCQICYENNSFVNEKMSYFYIPIFELFTNNKTTLGNKVYFELCQTMNWKLYLLFFDYHLSEVSILLDDLENIVVDKLLFQFFTLICDLIEMDSTAINKYNDLKLNFLDLSARMKNSCDFAGDENDQILWDSYEFVDFIFKYYDKLFQLETSDLETQNLAENQNKKFKFVRQLLCMVEYKYQTFHCDISIFEKFIRLVYKIIIENLHFFVGCDIFDSLTRIVSNETFGETFESSLKSDTFWLAVFKSFSTSTFSDFNDLYIWDIIRKLNDCGIPDEQLRNNLNNMFTFAVMVIVQQYVDSPDYFNYLIKTRIELFNFEKLKINAHLDLSQLDRELQSNKSDFSNFQSGGAKKALSAILLNFLVSILETFEILLNSLLTLNSRSNSNAYIVHLLVKRFGYLTNLATSTPEILSESPQNMLILVLLPKFIENHAIISIRAIDKLINMLDGCIKGFNSEILFANSLVYFPAHEFSLSLLQSLNELAVLSKTHSWTGKQSTLIISCLVKILELSMDNEPKRENACHLIEQYCSNCSLSLPRSTVNTIVSLLLIKNDK